MGVVYLAPQYYIGYDINIGLQYELEVAGLYDYLLPLQTWGWSHTTPILPTEEIRTSLGMGIGLGSALLVVSPRFKLHLPGVTLHSSYDIRYQYP